MRFAFSEDQQVLKSSARRVLEKIPSWQTIAELGWPALAIPESYGGIGLGWVELCAILEETGRVLLDAPLLSAAIGADALVQCGTEQQRKEYLPALAEGRLRATLVLDQRAEQSEARRCREPVASGLPVVDEGWALDGMSADLFVFPGPVLATADGVERRPLAALDGTRALAEIRLVGEGQAMAGDLDVVKARAAVALSAEQVGGAERCLEMAVDYAKTRHQFGRPIGSFQAIKHMCADMLVRVESARSACYWAAWTASVGDEELPVAAALAKAWCSETFFRNAADNIQIHGGIGFTWEHAAHLYFRRARASLALFGEPAQHREEVARRIGL